MNDSFSSESDMKRCVTFFLCSANFMLNILDIRRSASFVF